MNHCFVATGGGVVVDGRNLKIMQDSGKIVWLKASPPTIIQRTVNDKSTRAMRPALTPKGQLAEIEEKLEQRTPLYVAVAVCCIETDIDSIHSAAAMIIKRVESLIKK